MIKELARTDPGKTTPAGAALRRAAIILAIALIAWAAALLFTGVAPGPAGRANDFFYDVFYRLRPETDMRTSAGGDVVLVTADEPSLRAVNERFDYGWPWPREIWGQIAAYADKSGARAIAFDLVFEQTSVYQKLTGDDTAFADAINALKAPVIFGATAKDDHTWEKFAPRVNNPTFGAVNVGNAKVYRWYQPVVNTKPSLAVATLRKLDLPADATAPFRLRFYGPQVRKNGQQTFTFLTAAAVLGAQIDGAEGAKKYGISPDFFKGKIVILCTTAVGTYDLKASPLSDEYPGPEVQATAIENLLRGDRVIEIPAVAVAVLSLAIALIVTLGVVFPRQAGIKLIVPLAVTAIFLAAAIALFRNQTIRWLPPLEPLLAIVIATPLAFAWTYFAEDRQRRFMLQALSKVVSPAVADALSRNPERLARGTIRTELTLLFTDLANFTDLSEGMDVQTLGHFMNRYLGEMSDQVFSRDGTLDKYIGDAVMAFWNAPLPQADHAVRACEAALLMVAREKQLHAELIASSSAASDPGRRLFTRIGVNTATVAVGFIGSEHLFNYTALGDGVNLASRLEGANKLYGTRILLSANTAALVKDVFWLRPVDVLRVKGKREPMAVFELRGKRGGTDDQRHADLIAAYTAAFDAYHAKNWDAAEQILLELSGRFGQDGPAEALLARVREFRDHPPDPAWDGVYISSSK